MVSCAEHPSSRNCTLYVDLHLKEFVAGALSLTQSVLRGLSRLLHHRASFIERLARVLDLATDAHPIELHVGVVGVAEQLEVARFLTQLEVLADLDDGGPAGCDLVVQLAAVAHEQLSDLLLRRGVGDRSEGGRRLRVWRRREGWPGGVG